MLFHTWTFLVFFAVVYGVYLRLRSTHYWLHWLLVSSYFFYGWWNPLYLVLIFYSTLLDFFCVARMDHSKHKRRWLAISIFNNLFLLGFFKYAGFVVTSLNQVLHSMSVAYAIQAPDILLPVGISFFTFQSMSYTIDFYRGEIDRETSFIRFATYVSLFPQLVAGPIERARTLLPQMRHTPRVTGSDVGDGLSLFIVGLFKKLALADYLALYVDPVYASPESYSASSLLLATFAFAWQIYFDFSGYTDMARGIARALGFRLMLNFNHPYLATSMGDFWSRWHISLSTWFRDYVYIPLGGNRRSRRQMYRNIVITMVVSGLWHGAAWTFVVWGAIHAFATCALRPWERSSWYLNRVPKVAKQGFIFVIVCLAWIFFRADSLTDAGTILVRIGQGAFEDPRFPILLLTLVGLIWSYQWMYESRLRTWLERRAVRIAFVVLMVLYLFLVPGRGGEQFIYFQF